MTSGEHIRPAALALLLALAACSGGTDQKNGGAGGGRGGGGPKGPPEVGYVVIQRTSTPITAELSGRTAAFESSDVRPQVGGIIRKRLFTEGALVRAGQTLYQIDPSLYQAATNQAQANLQAAQATAEASRIQAERYAPLARIQAVSKQEYTNAIAQARQGSAQVAQNRAALETARINLRFTTVPAPITGRIGRSLFTVGALVSPSQTDPLAQIQRLDPIYVDVQQSAADMLTLRRSLTDRNGVLPTRAQVRLKLEDGSDYPLTGSIEFAEVVVDQSTGTVTLRARFPNPQGVLLPGMFVRANFAQAVDTRAFLVPMQAVSRDPKGNATLFIVGPSNRALQRTVTADRTQGAFWVVTAGLNGGEKIITQGLTNVKANQPIRPVPADTPQRVGAPKRGGGGRGNTPEAGSGAGAAGGAGGGGASKGG